MKHNFNNKIKEIFNFVITLILYAILGFILVGIYYYVQSPDFALKKEIFRLQLILYSLPIIEIIKDIINNIRRK